MTDDPTKAAWHGEAALPFQVPTLDLRGRLVRLGPSLDAMLERTETRFLIITHHPLTMARMNRLYGVTMMERGVSQLVSVDLETAEQMAEAG